VDFRSIVPDELPTPARLFLWGAVFNGLGNGIFNVILQLYLTSLGFTSSNLGSVFMMNAIGAAILTVPMGVLADRYGKKRIMLAGALAVALSVILILTSKSVLMFQLGFLLIGVSNATGVIISPLYSSFFEKDDLDKAFGLYGALNIATVSLGSLMGFIPPYLVDSYGFNLQSSYWLLLSLGAALFLSQFVFYMSSMRGMREPVKGEGPKFMLQSRGLVAKFCIISILSSLSYGVFFSLFPYYVNKKFGIESDALGALFFTSNLVAAGAMAASSRISKRYGTLTTMVLSMGLAAPFYLLTPLAPSYLALSILYVGRVGIRVIADPLLNSVFMKNIGDDEKSTANSIRMMAMQGANVVGPWASGQLMDRTSMELPAYVGGGLYAALAVFTLVLLRDTGPGTEMKAVLTVKAGFDEPAKGGSKLSPLVPNVPAKD
jgi:MFS family permease